MACQHTSMLNAVRQLSRLTLTNVGHASAARSFHTQGAPLAFQVSESLQAEPMKKRKKMDMNVIVQRELKKMRRIDKAIRKIKSKGRKLKPVEEIEGDRQLLKTLSERKRAAPALSFEESEQRAVMHKEWARCRKQQYNSEMKQIIMATNEQQRALEELQKESEELYQMAIQLDDSLIPLHCKGPVRTPPIKDYHLDAPDGIVTDTTKVFDK